MNIPEKHKSKNKKFTKAKITKASETLRKIAKIAGVNINGKEPYDIIVNNDDPLITKQSIISKKITYGFKNQPDYFGCMYNNIKSLF